MKRIIGKINPEDRHVHIWGAGFSGLVLGYYLKDQGYKITIHEKSNRVGGKIHTKKSGPGLVEKAANALYLNQDGLELLRELKLEPLPASKKLKRLLMQSGKPRRPFQPGLISKVISNAYRKPPLIGEGLTVADFFEPLLGADKLKSFVSPVLGGLYATPAEALHFKSLFPEVAKKAQFPSYWDFIRTILKLRKLEPKMELSGSVSFEGGMQTLVNRLAEVLKHDIKLNSKDPIRLKGNTIVCTDAISASELLKEMRPEISLELSRIKYQEMSSVTVFLKREIRSLHRSFGVVIPRDEGFKSIGILNNKAIFPANNENVLSYTFIAPIKMTEEDLLSDLKNLIPEISKEDVDHMEFTHWERGLPRYDLQLYLAIKRLHQLGKQEHNLAIFGNYVAGISLRDMISAAKSFSRNPADYSTIS
jgi:protoporphyrinogen/coproporphyrinogen III oxidase